MRFQAILELGGKTATGTRVYSERRWFVLGIDDAKTAETRARRIERAVARLREGRGQR